MAARKPKAVAMAVAGLDPSGGAGLSADIRAFTALGVYCAPVISAITVQDTRGVYAVRPVEADLLKRQLEAVLEDLRPSWAKVGVLYSAENVKLVAELLPEKGVELVVDPVLRAGTGGPLLEHGALEALRDELIPRAFIITPNAREAGELAGIQVRSIKDAKKAARALALLGPEGVVVKGGHIRGLMATDVLYYEGRFYEFRRPRFDVDAHGSGCAFSSFLTALLALGEDVPSAVEKAGDLAYDAIRWSISVGSGRPVAEPSARLLREAERYAVLREVEEAVGAFLSEPKVTDFIPEVGTQIGMAISMPSGPEDVAAVEGRIVRAGARPVAVGPVRFGASSHVARIILAAMRYDPGMRSAMNMAYRPGLLEALKRMGLTVASFDRSREPPDVAMTEGASLPWGVEEAIKACGGRVPDAIYDLGAVGKEPMIRLLGRSAREVVKKALRAVRMASG